MENHHCSAAQPAAAQHCEDHSGQQAWQRGIAALLVIATGLLSYSVFWQAPAIKTEIAKEQGRVDGEIKLVKKDVEVLTNRVTKLEEKESRDAP